MAVNTDISILAASRAMRSIAAGMINVAFPYYILTDLHYGAFVIGALYFSATAANALLGFLSGITTDVWGRRRTLITAGLLLPLSALMVYASRSLGVIAAAAMLGGYSATGALAGGGIGGVVQPIQNAVLADIAPAEKRTGYFSLITFISGAAAAFGALAAGFFEVRDIFLVAAVVSLSGIPALWRIRVRERKGEIGRLKTKLTIGKFTLTGILNGFSQGLVVPFLIPFFVLVYHLPKAEMSFYASLGSLLGSAALLSAPALERRLGFVRSIIFTRGAGVLLFAIFPVFRLLPLSVLIYVIAPSLRVAALPIQQSELTKRVEENEMGRALGINQVARLLASAAGVMAGGYFMDAGWYAVPFFAYGAIMAGNLWLYVKFFGRGKQGERAADDDGNLP